MPAAFKCLAPAKINLCLHVTGQREDGYHLLDSLVAFTRIGDEVVAAEHPTFEIHADGPFAENLPPGSDNLIAIAANHLAEGALHPPARGRITLTKSLPVASGLGGGSADAAAAIKILTVLWGVTGNPLEAAKAAGADGPMCLFGRTARARGIGDVLESAPALPHCYVLLVNPRVSIATPQIFRMLERRDAPPLPEPEYPDLNALVGYLKGTENTLEGAAIRLEPIIQTVLTSLRDAPGCLFARMSGSGATCFGLFEAEADAVHAAILLERRFPKWWVKTTEFLSEPAAVEEI